MSAQLIDRLNAARQKVEDISRRRERLQGELDVHHKNLAELEEKSREDFDCEVDDLPDLIEKLEREGEEAIARAEKLLGVQ